jgi:hypothetical protein
LQIFAKFAHLLNLARALKGLKSNHTATSTV